MRLTCPRCHTTYVDPSPAAAVEPRDCPWCGHTTSAAPAQPLDLEDYQRALDVAKTLGPPSPKVDFFLVPGSTDVAVLVDGDPAGVLTQEQFEELKAKLEKLNA